MLTRKRYLEIVSGQAQDTLASLLRCGLSTLTPGYRLAIAIRNFRFDRAAAKIGRFSENSSSPASPNQSLIRIADISVISIGNLTTGGTGKTPFVAKLAKLLANRGQKVAIISRGYGADHTGRNDEARELDFRLPHIPHLQSSDRYAMVQKAIADHGAQVVLLDDGFQHRGLHRNLDIVLIDGTNPFGYGRLLPRGLLREPLSSLRRSQAIVLTRCELVPSPRKQEIENQIRQLHPQALLVTAQTRPTGWLATDGAIEPLDVLESQAVAMFCGIGNPASFHAALQKLNVKIVYRRDFPDHHQFSREDLHSLIRDAIEAGAAALVCTHKDLVKVIGWTRVELPIYALIIETEIVSHADKLIQLIMQAARIERPIDARKEFDQR